jgi:nucleotide-binding universal stress UspA family protein
VIVPEATGAPISVKEYAIQSAEAHLQDIVARLAKDGVTATGVIKLGVPVDEINTTVDEHKIDLVVMGTHGRTGLRHLMAGSVAERVVRSSRVPVLTIRHAE